MSRTKLKEITDFLLGEAPLNGMWFGGNYKGKPKYWWREHLRNIVKKEDNVQKVQVKEAKKEETKNVRHHIIDGIRAMAECSAMTHHAWEKLFWVVGQMGILREDSPNIDLSLYEQEKQYQISVIINYTELRREELDLLMEGVPENGIIQPLKQRCPVKHSMNAEQYFMEQVEALLKTDKFERAFTLYQKANKLLVKEIAHTWGVNVANDCMRCLSEVL